MKQKEFLELFSKNINRIHYSAGDDLKGKEGHTERKFKGRIDREEIRELNQSGYGIYFTVNKFRDNERKKHLCQKIRAVFCEDDYSGKLVTNWPLPPSIVVNSSPGKYHYYWLTNSRNYDEFELVMQTMVDKHNCDNHARDISRVLRIPGTYHKKKKTFRVKVVGGNSRKYKWEVIRTAFPPAKEKKSNYTKGEGFDIGVAVAELTSTKDLHGSMISIAMSLVNRNVDKKTFRSFMQLAHDNIDFTDIPTSRALDVNTRFDDIHLDECYDSAVERIRGEIDVADEIEHHHEYAKAKRLKDEILAPENTIIGELTREIMKTWWKPNLMISSLCARQAIAYLAGGSYQASTGDRLNMQQVAVGDTGIGKDPILFSTPDVIGLAFKDDKPMLRRLLGGIIDEAGSAEGLDDRIRSMGDKHDIIFVKDEIGELIQQASGGNAHKMGIFNYILKMYTKSNGISNERAKAKSKDDAISQVLYAPHFIMSAATTAELIVEGLSAKFVSIGLMSRMMLFNADPYSADRLRKIEKLQLSRKVIRALKRIANTDKMNTQLHPMPSARVYNPRIVEFPDDVVEYCYQQSLRDDKRQGELKSVWNRRVPNAKKYSMIDAIAENPKKPIVTMEMIERNMKFVANSCSYTVRLFEGNVGENDEEIAQKDILRILFKYGEKWIPSKTIGNSRKVRKLSAIQRNNLVREMLSDNLIESEVKDNIRGKNTILYRLSAEQLKTMGKK